MSNYNSVSVGEALRKLHGDGKNMEQEESIISMLLLLFRKGSQNNCARKNNVYTKIRLYEFTGAHQNLNQLISVIRLNIS